MMYEYTVVPAPKKGLKAKGVKSNEDRFAFALQSTMNELGAQGWEYLRTDTLPTEERQGLTGRTTTYQNMMVFKRPLAVEEAPVEEVEEEMPALFLTSQKQVAEDTDDTVMRLEPAPLRAERPSED